MKPRVLTAVPLALLVAWLVYQPREWPFLLAVIATVELSLVEFYGICRGSGLDAFAAIGYLAAALFCIAPALFPHHRTTAEFALLLALALAPFLPILAAQNDLSRSLGRVAATILGVVYVGFTLSCLIPLRFADPKTGRLLIAFLFVVVWAGDMFAYFIGRSVGRTPFFQKISPRKTLEGAVAGLAGSVIAGLALAHWLWRAESMKTIILLSAIVAIAGQTGDLAESAIKRGANMKDSGHLLPGHGGMLDRIDSLLFAAPVMWIAWTIARAWRW